MKNFFAKFFDLRAYDNWNLGAFFLLFIVYAVMDVFIPDGYEILYLILAIGLNIAVIVFDQNELRKAEANVPSAWWILLMPVYVYMREKKNGKKNLRVAHAYLLIMLASMIFGFSADNARNPERVASDVCPIVDTIDLYRNARITCTRAYNFTEQYDGFWKGRVHLSNNMIVSVTADYNQKDGSVYVQTQGISDDAGY